MSSEILESFPAKTNTWLCVRKVANAAALCDPAAASPRCVKLQPNAGPEHALPECQPKLSPRTQGLLNYSFLNCL